MVSFQRSNKLKPSVVGMKEELGKSISLALGFVAGLKD